LAIDYGQKRIGLAISDEMGLTAQPLQTLERTNRRNDLRRLREIVRKQGVQRIIVGHPLHLDGSESEMAAEAARFAARIEKELGLPVELADERLSSWEAEQVLAEAGKKKRAGDAVDHVAAAIILRNYLARAKSKE
jgi:putative Holliday junction resolvase